MVVDKTMITPRDIPMSTDATDDQLIKIDLVEEHGKRSRVEQAMCFIALIIVILGFVFVIVLLKR